MNTKRVLHIFIYTQGTQIKDDKKFKKTKAARIQPLYEESKRF